MQDYIFNSHRKKAQKRNRAIFRLFLLLSMVTAGVILIPPFLDSSTKTEVEKPSSRDDVLSLPPAKETHNLQVPAIAESTVQHTPAEQAITPLANAQIILEPAPLPIQAETVVPEKTELPATAVAAQDEISWLNHEIKQGESLASIFKRQKLSPNLLHRIVNSSDVAGELARIRPGQTIKFGFDKAEQLQQLILQRNQISSLHIAANDDSFSAQEQLREVDKKQSTAKGIIETSLFIDGQKAGLSDGQIMELAGIFGWDIDFALEIRNGDSFSILYEEHYLDGKKIRNGPILAAEFINTGTVYRALRYEDDEQNVGYFDHEGRSKRRAFIRTPVKFARISSGFTRKRWHPVLKKWRSHKGVDYAARSGTPIKATGNGKVTFRGRKGGYGKVVFIRHGGKYTTVYGHMSKFSRKVKNGSKVKQGQIIGYVGSTGLATGPHLHYEFRVNGVHRNPLTVKLPKSDPLPKRKLKDFQHKTVGWIAMLDEMTSQKMVASANQNHAQ